MTMPYTKQKVAVILTMTGLLSAGCGLVAQARGPRVVGSGPVRTHVRKVAAFTKIKVGLGTTVEIEVGPSPSLEIDAQDNIEKIIDSDVKSGELTIDSHSNYTGAGPIKLRIKTPSLDGITILGSSQVTANKFQTKALAIAINGAGDIVFEGSCDDVSVAINGSGRIDLSKFASKTAQVNINGAGNVKVDPRDALTVSISGSGEITYSGNPTVTKAISGSGSVNKA
jgi:hypothetical protein